MRDYSTFNVDIAKRVGLLEASVYSSLQTIASYVGDSALTLTSDAWSRLFPFARASDMVRCLKKLAAHELIEIDESSTDTTATIRLTQKQKTRKRRETTITETPDVVKYVVVQDGAEVEMTSTVGQLVNMLLEKFKNVHPGYVEFYKRRAYRNALERMIKSYNVSLLFRMLDAVPHTNLMAYAPVITTPIDFERLAPKLVAFMHRKRAEIEEKTNNYAL